MSTLRLVADDLTGALDAAAQFTGSIGAIPCALGPRAPWLADLADRSVAVNAATRDDEESRALVRAVETAPIFDRAQVAFKKIDSLLRGHWAAEIAAVNRLRQFAAIVFCPAFPAQKRIMREGRQWVAGPDGAWAALPIDPTAELERRGVRVVRAERGEIASARDADLIVWDAEVESDLDRVVQASRASLGPMLWCGTAGLARALSGSPAFAAKPRDASHLAIIGTRHPVSRMQVAEILARAPGCVVPIDDDPPENARRLATALAEGNRCLALPAPMEEMSTTVASAIVARRLRETFARIAAPAQVTVAGGETVLALCDALGTEYLRVEGEVSPGLPASVMVGGSWDGTLVFSKSGAFGDGSTLLDLLGPER